MSLFSPDASQLRITALAAAKDLSRKDDSLKKVLKRAERITEFLVQDAHEEIKGETANNVLSHIESDLRGSGRLEGEQLDYVLSLIAHVAEGEGLTRKEDVESLPDEEFDITAVLQKLVGDGLIEEAPTDSSEPTPSDEERANQTHAVYLDGKLDQIREFRQRVDQLITETGLGSSPLSEVYKRVGSELDEFERRIHENRVAS